MTVKPSEPQSAHQSPNQSNSPADGNSVFIALGNNVYDALVKYHDDLDNIWIRAIAQKDQLAHIEELLPNAFNNRMKVYHRPGVDDAEREKFVSDPDAVAQTAILQRRLAQIEEKTLETAVHINRLQRTILDDKKNSGKILDKPDNDRFNDLRRKVSLITSLVADVYRDDPPCDCTGP
ncbi:hypothetical protein HY230_09805 [Candidatus Acetothermia bacterium]|nr:hypothetical protein [Candidatus Acetothermia bacterium]